MKKKEIYEARVIRSIFPDTGIVQVEDREVAVKHTLPGQTIRFAVTRVRSGISKGMLLETVHPSDAEQESACPHAAVCGGCSYQTLPYEAQLSLLETQIRELLRDVVPEEAFLPIKPSPVVEGYRNKMELTFGDEEKDGPLVVGLHKRGSFYDLTPVTGCRIMDEEFRTIAAATESFFRESGTSFYHRKRHEGVLRHLLLRKGTKTKELLVDLVTTSQADPEELAAWAEKIRELPLSGSLAGILHTKNDGVADTIANEETTILFGADHFEEELLGLRFVITPFSFFQTNSLGAEVLYETARSFIGDIAGKNVFDLYSGTGTIAQTLAPVCHHVTGVEIVEEAVEAAKENAVRNGLDNCTFLAGDVLKVLDTIPELPDTIVLDPPRDGVHPKALQKILAYGVDRIVYISCKPTSLARDLVSFRAAGYEVRKCVPVDMFPGTAHVETVVLMSRKAENGLK